MSVPDRRPVFGLEAKLHRVLRDNDRLRRKNLSHEMARMGIDVNSEVGRYVLDNYRPVVTDEAFTSEAIFDFLTELIGDDR